MTKSAVLRLLVLIWASTAFGLNMYALVSDDRDAVETIHEIKHVILDSTDGQYTPEVAFAETQWQMLNRSRLWHSGTALILVTVSLWGFRRPYGGPNGVRAG
jgi:hypothetical protein